MKLLTHREPRLKATCVILTQTVKLPTTLYEQKFLKFLEDQGEPVEVKPSIIGALVRNPSAIDEKKSIIGGFLKSEMPLGTRIETYNAIASDPSDQSWHANLVAIGLRDRDEHVRQFAISLLQRLGPNAILRHGEAERVLALKPQ